MAHCATLPSIASEESKTILALKCKYDPSSPSGATKNRGRKTSTLGTLRKDGYWSTQLNKKNLQVHRIVWTLVHGAIPKGLEVDHIDRNPSNNRIENLRLVTRSVNGRNRKVPKQSKSGYRYIHTCSKTGHFAVRIGSTGHGTFATLKEAIAKRDSVL